MSSDSTPSPTADSAGEPIWGAPQPGRKWTSRHTLAAAGVVAVIAAFGGAAIYAATAGHSTATGPGGFGLDGGPGPGFHDGRRALGTTDPADALHGEFVVAENGC